MQNQEMKNGIRRLAVHFGIVLIIVLAVLTFFSKTINNMLLPEVTAELPKSGMLAETMRRTATPTYREVHKVYSPVDIPLVDEVFAKAGSQTAAKGKIAHVNPELLKQIQSKYRYDIASMELTVTSSREALKKFRGKKPEKQRMTMDLNEMQRQLDGIKADLHALTQMFDAQGNLLASAKGNVLQVNIADNGTIAKGQLLFVYAVDGSPMYLQWRETKTKGDKFAIGDMANLHFVFRSNDLGVPKTGEVKLPITDISFDPQTQEYVFSVDVPQEIPGLNALTDAEVTVASKSEQYQCLVPKNAVVLGGDSTQEDGSIFIVGEDLITKELTVRQMPVTVLNKNDFLCAVDVTLMEGEKVVISSSKPLSDGMNVNMR